MAARCPSAAAPGTSAHGSNSLPKLTGKARSQLWLFVGAYLVYTAGRWLTVSDLAPRSPIYALFPVAPPRLAVPEMVDTMSAQAPVQPSGRSTMFYNELAVVPSLHCGFALAVGIALAAASQRRLTQLLALAWGPIVCLTVVATGNHYVFDIAAGLAVTAVGYGVGVLLRAGARRSRSATGWWRHTHDARRDVGPPAADAAGARRRGRRAGALAGRQRTSTAAMRKGRTAGQRRVPERR